jgi:hypothetical protein
VERVCTTDTTTLLVSDLNLTVLRGDVPLLSGQSNADPVSLFTEGPLASILIDLTGVHRADDGTLSLLLTSPCKNGLL